MPRGAVLGPSGCALRPEVVAGRAGSCRSLDARFRSLHQTRRVGALLSSKRVVLSIAPVVFAAHGGSRRQSMLSRRWRQRAGVEGQRYGRGDWKGRGRGVQGRRLQSASQRPVASFCTSFGAALQRHERLARSLRGGKQRGLTVTALPRLRKVQLMQQCRGALARLREEQSQRGERTGQSRRDTRLPAQTRRHRSVALAAAAVRWRARHATCAECCTLRSVSTLEQTSPAPRRSREAAAAWRRLAAFPSGDGAEEGTKLKNEQSAVSDRTLRPCGRTLAPDRSPHRRGMSGEECVCV